MIGVGFVPGALAIAALGSVGATTAGLLAVTFVAGLFGIGSQMCLAAVCAGFYEASSRATAGAAVLAAVAIVLMGRAALGVSHTAAEEIVR